MKKSLWVESYRPSKLDDYVWSSPAQKSQVESWIADRSIPHLCLIGSPGLGKTSLALMLLKLLGVEKSDIKFINGCTDNGIEVVRDIENFISTMAMGDYRYVVIDEFDFFTPNAQAGLKNMIEQYSQIAIKSRCQTFDMQSLDRDQFFERIATILVTEGVDLNESNLEILDDYVGAAYPDLRKCINMLQQNCINGVLSRPSSMTASGTADYVVQAVGMFKDGRITEARKLLAPKLNNNEFEEVYRLLYQNLSWWGKTEQQQNAAIVTIANRLKDHSLVADPEICLSACLVELEMIRHG